MTIKEKIKENSITRYFISKFKNVEIREYLLPIDFESIPNKMHYLTSISKAFKLENVPYEDQLDSLINNFREKNNVPVLLYDNNFPAFFLIIFHLFHYLLRKLFLNIVRQNIYLNIKIIFKLIIKLEKYY